MTGMMTVSEDSASVSGMRGPFGEDEEELML